MPRQNRPVVRDGRIQAPPASKKRTDRSYLQPESSSPPPVIEDEPVVAEAAPSELSTEASAADPTAVFAAPASPMPTSAPRPTPAPRVAQAVPARPGGVVRALQQQGIRKRSDVDLDALAKRDTSYALHELRRIGILTVLVVVALVVLTIVLR